MQYIDLPDQQRLVFARHGPMLINLHDHYMGGAIATYGEYSQLEAEFILQWMPPGRDAVEVGANMGCITVPLAKHLAAQGRRLMAIEPQPVIFQQLCANLALSGVRNVHAVHGACAPEQTKLYFRRPDYAQGGNFGAVSLHNSPRSGDENITAKPLDDWLDPAWDVGFIKIDVEGMEAMVLQGALQTLTQSRSVLYLENDQSARSKELIELLWSFSYELWFHLPQMFNPDNFAQHADNLYPNTVSINMLCLPKGHPVHPEQAPISDSSWHPLTVQPASVG